MEEEKAAAYYEELTRKGSGAARFKQGLGFSSTVSDTAVPERGSFFASSSSSFLSSFVRASESCSVKAEEKSEKHSQLQSIQNKLKKKDSGTSGSNHGEKLKERDRDRSKDRERERDRDRHPRRRSRSRSRERDRDRNIDGERRRRSRSKERDRGKCRDRRRRSRSRSKERDRERYRDRSSSSGYRRSEKERGDLSKKVDRFGKKDKNGAIDHAKLIEGYDQMTPAEKVKAKMKLQLSETAGKDTNMGSGIGWERFDFDKDAPVDNDDDDEEIEGGGDDAAIVKSLGQSFRFSNVQARREDAHDKAMFGAPIAVSPSITMAREQEQSEDRKSEVVMDEPEANLLSEKVLAKQQGSWRDRALRKS